MFSINSGKRLQTEKENRQEMPHGFLMILTLIIKRLQNQIEYLSFNTSIIICFPFKLNFKGLQFVKHFQKPRLHSCF